MANWKELSFGPSALKGTNPQERAQLFYKKVLVPSLSDDVLKAELARQAGKHQTIRVVFCSWTAEQKDGVHTDQRILAKLAQREAQREIDLTRERDMLKSGFAGLGRIEHVDTNSELKNTPKPQRVPLLLKIREVRELYNRLGLDTLVPWAIHGGSIHWLSEIAQDTFNTRIILGLPEQAREICLQAIQQNKTILEFLRARVDLTTPEEELRSKSYEQWKLRKVYLGSLSAQGVLWYRLGKADRDTSKLTVGLEYVKGACRYEPNYHRLATIALWNIKGALGWHFSCRYMGRCLVFIRGATAFIQAFKGNPKDATSALRQFLNERYLA